LRNDARGRPVVIRPESLYVTTATGRRSSGTHYTPRSLTEAVVRYTLEPLVYVGPAEGKPKQEWKLRSAAELVNLRICDVACGAGAFLVQACRYLGERLVEAWEEAIDNCKLGEQPVPADPDERLVCALRVVARHCLYGVDKDPLAVEIAKLSLWLLTRAKDEPFTFLDHAVRCGDSLVGLGGVDLHIPVGPPGLRSGAGSPPPALTGGATACRPSRPDHRHPELLVEPHKPTLRSA
jgi:hypothetical protein